MTQRSAESEKQSVNVVGSAHTSSVQPSCAKVSALQTIVLPLPSGTWQPCVPEEPTLSLERPVLCQLAVSLSTHPHSLLSLPRLSPNTALSWGCWTQLLWRFSQHLQTWKKENKCFPVSAPVLCCLHYYISLVFIVFPTGSLVLLKRTWSQWWYLHETWPLLMTALLTSSSCSAFNCLHKVCFPASRTCKKLK